MPRGELIERVVDLTDPTGNVIYNMSVEQARACVASGDTGRVAQIDGHFALLGQQGQTVFMARSLGRLMRYFIAKLQDGPCLIVSDRIDAIRRWLDQHELLDQFHPSYTRMVPAHYITRIDLVGCPDPNPRYHRFFTPQRGTLGTDLDADGRTYVGALAEEIAKWLRRLPDDAPVGVSFSGGVDSGAVFCLAYHVLCESGMTPGRLKAFTLAVEGGGADLDQARRFLEALDLQMFLEPIDVQAGDIDVVEAIRVMEDYKPLDVQAAAMTLALYRGIRRRYPDWRYLLDGDGGDENLKDYPIEENPELTIRSVLNNPLLYHEGWGIESIKHSLVYGGGLSRGYARTYAPAQACGFEGFSPHTLPRVVAVAEALPFVELTDWDHDRLYRLKGEVVSRGVKAVTGLDMPVFAKRRFQHGAIAPDGFADRFPTDPLEYRRAFHALYAT